MNTAELIQDERNVASIGVIERRAGPTQASSAPSGGRELRAVSERGGQIHRAGPTQTSSAPSGARELHEATSLGAAICFA